ncbi:MAG: nickel pincer cofactor biosynthesis protein LarC [Kofleriaceae bacterium]|nr:nickel pincer cofactor biosynthesis protein LarC [Kofleriaceae bacterium]
MSDNIRGQHLHFDCVSGIAGDMSLGAFIDLGVPAQVIVDAIIAVGLGDDRLRHEPIIKSGIAATNAWVRCSDDEAPGQEGVGQDVSGQTSHDHDHTHYSDIRARIEGSSLLPEVIEICLRIFDRLAEAEAKLHGTTVEKVAFHEVGAIDSIVDIVGAAAAFHWLAPVSVSSSPIAMGRGTIRCAHGILPVPSPAALEILCRAGAPMSDGGIDKELCTPTGAAIMSAMVSDWQGMPTLVPIRIGYGAGDIDLPDRPNVLRIVVGKIVGQTQQQEPHVTDAHDSIVEIEANIDDMNSEFCQHVSDELFAAGAVDVWWTAVTMKKGRPALVLRVLCPPEHSDKAMRVLLSETTSLGLRFQTKSRLLLDRENKMVETEYGPISIKLGMWSGVCVNASPEYEACRQQAIAHKVPLKQVFAAATSKCAELFSKTARGPLASDLR